MRCLELGKKIQNQAQEEMTKAQREYFLREQLKAIQQELGEESEEATAINELRQKIEEAHMPEEVAKEALRELSRLEKHSLRLARILGDPHVPGVAGLAALGQEHRQAD